MAFNSALPIYDGRHLPGSRRRGTVAVPAALRHGAAVGSKIPEGADEFAKLSAVFPSFWTLAGSFTQITVPANFTITAGKSGWFPLIDLDTEALGQEVVLFGAYFDALSPDTVPVDPATRLAWGETHGLGAALVVGENLPVGTAANNFWQEQACPFAGVESSGASVLEQSDHNGRVLFSRSFPPGSYATGWQKRALNMATVPFVHRITRGNRIGAGLVIRGSQLAPGGVSKLIEGFGQVELYVGLTRNLRNLESVGRAE